MEWIIRISQFLLSLSILIVLHELGHFIPAKLFKTRVEKFFLFFDYKFALFKKKIGDTVYGIGWIPLGGYVKIAGMVDESMDTEQLKKDPQPWEYRSKPAWQRLIIITGGVIVNMIVGILIFTMIAFVWGDSYIKNTDLRDGVWVPDTTISKVIGIKTGDKIVKVDTDTFNNFLEINEALLYSGGKKIEVIRNGQPLSLAVPADVDQELLRNLKGSMVMPRYPFFIGEISDSSHNAKAGFESGDLIVGIAGKPVTYFDQVRDTLQYLKGQQIEVRVKRGGTELPIMAQVNNNGLLGIGMSDVPMDMLEEKGYYKITRVEYSLFESFPRGIERGFKILSSYVRQFKILFTPEGAKKVGGFVSMTKIFSKEWDWLQFWSNTAMISIILAFMNILPIPALDGGHMMFILYEMIFRRKPSDKFLERAQMVGFFMVLALLLLANGNDIINLIFN